jgi:hypothetical protein
MTDPEEILRDSPVDFDSAVAYALHPEMRRLLILYVAGTVLLPVGLTAFLDPPFLGFVFEVVVRLIGLAITVVAAAFLFGGVVGAAFKVVTDANILAKEH